LQKEEGDSGSATVPYQFEALDDDLDTAINLSTGILKYWYLRLHAQSSVARGEQTSFFFIRNSSNVSRVAKGELKQT
jgi:hypothetical protein